MISVFNMASSSRSIIRTIGVSMRQPVIPISTGIPRRFYATESDIRGSAPTAPVVPELSLYGSASARNAGQTTMKRYTGPGFPKIPGLRHLVHPHHPHLHAGAPVRDLTIPLRRNGGRNDSGQVVNRGVGGGHRKRLRIVDFHRNEAGEHDVVRIEYDPGRSAHIALLKARIAGVKDVSVEEGAALAELEGVESTEAGENIRSRNEVRGGWSYILAPEGLRAGDAVTSYRSGIPSGLVDGWSETPSETDPSAPQSVNPPESGTSRALGLLRTMTLKPGNVLPLYLIPSGTNIHNISMKPQGRMQLCRSAGSYGQIVAHHGPKGEALGGAQILSMGGSVGEDGKLQKKNGSVLVKLQSGEVRRLEPGCVATIGTVSNKEHHSAQLGKAGRARWLGQKPIVRGLAMNACDHPHGGGRGKSKGNRHPRSVYGWLTKGKRTRRSKDKDGNKMVVSERPRGKASKK